MKMTPEDKPEGFMGANPYNAQKVDKEVERGVPGANDGLAYKPNAKTVVVDTMSSPKEEEPVQDTQSVEDEQEAKPYQRVDWKKRYDDMKRHYDTKLNEWRDEKQRLKEQANAGRPEYKPPKTKEELEEFKKEYPDIYGVVETVAHMYSSQKSEEMETELTALKDQLKWAEGKAAYAELKRMVPDYEEIRVSDDFHEWAEQQPDEIQNWVYKNSTNAALAAKAINLYKVDRGIGTAQRPPVQTQVNRGADQMVKTSRVVEEPSPKEKVFKRSEIASMSLSEYQQRRNEIDKAFAEGRVVEG